MGDSRIFWITPRWPLPVEDGARQASFHLVNNLARQGVRIHLVAIVPQGESVDLEAARRAFEVERVSVVFREPSRHLRNLLTRPWQPVTFAPYLTQRVSRQILALHQAWDPKSVVVADGLHAAGWLQSLGAGQRASIRSVLRAHNIESNLWRLGSAKEKFPKSLLVGGQAPMVAALEKKVCREARMVAAVSVNDEQGLRELYGEMRSVVTPIGIPLQNGSRTSDTFPIERKLLFVGRLDWQPNRDGLRWFLDEVWPEAVTRDPDLSLTIAGTGNGQWLAPYLGLAGLTFVGRVPDLAPYYRSCIASLVPIFFGSGTRVKAIEAGSHARACISTQIGVEGIGLEPQTNYFRAESREDWLLVLHSLSISEARDKGESAFRWISSEFDPAEIASRFMQELERSL
jgi:glycosyltransferase involved in cell wall biosynthesis